jgi:hypothetical protein
LYIELPVPNSLSHCRRRPHLIGASSSFESPSVRLEGLPSREFLPRELSLDIELFRGLGVPEVLSLGRGKDVYATLAIKEYVLSVPIRG